MDTKTVFVRIVVAGPIQTEEQQQKFCADLNRRTIMPFISSCHDAMVVNCSNFWSRRQRPAPRGITSGKQRGMINDTWVIQEESVRETSEGVWNEFKLADVMFNIEDV